MNGWGFLAAFCDVEEKDPTALQFAENFSQQFSFLAKSTPIYAELENLFRLRALLLAIYFKNDFSSVGIHYNSYLGLYKYIAEKNMQESLPGLANFKEIKFQTQNNQKLYTYYLFPMVCGGVGMDMKVEQNSFQSNDSLNFIRVDILRSRPSRDSLSWVARQ